MTRKTIHALVAIIVGLVLLLVVLRTGDIDSTQMAGQELLPEFKSVANDVSKLRIVRPTGEEEVTIRREDKRWMISARDDYLADLGKLRNLIIGLADAQVVEEKTSNPAHYAKLRVDDPEEGGKGTKVVLSGPSFTYSLVLGNTAQGNKRYARIADEATSYLIDQELDIPETAGDWLVPDIVDVDAGDVRRVTIAHADGETIVIEKSEREQTNFEVADIPEGRELSYATVGNGVAGALAKLTLDDVRAGEESSPTTTTTYETWDGLTVTAEVVSDDDSSWIAFSAGPTDEESAADDPAAEINARVSGWQYQIADYKKNLLTRRWEDILKAADE